MEERLDDAINVLRNHAESQLALQIGVGSVGPHGAMYAHTSPSQIDHLVCISFKTNCIRIFFFKPDLIILFLMF